MYIGAGLRTLLAALSVKQARPYFPIIGLPQAVAREPEAMQDAARRAAHHPSGRWKDWAGDNGPMHEFLRAVGDHYGPRVGQEMQAWLTRHELDDDERRRSEAWTSVLLAARRPDARVTLKLDDPARAVFFQEAERALGDAFWRHVDHATTAARLMGTTAQEDDALRLEVSQPGDAPHIDVPMTMEVLAASEQSWGAALRLQAALPTPDWATLLEWAEAIAAQDGHPGLDLEVKQ